MDQRITLPAKAEEIPVARAWARRIAPRVVRDDAELIVSELATNAVRHGSGSTEAGTMALRIIRKSDRLVLEVTDPGRGRVPAPAGAADDLAENGRGLLIVAALSERSGRRAADDGPGTTAWAEIRIGRAGRGPR